MTTEQPAVYIHNIVYRARFSCEGEMSRGALALAMGGILTLCDHAGPLTLYLSEPYARSFRIFEKGKTTITGCTTHITTVVALLDLARRISTILGKRVKPQDLINTNSQASAYLPYTVDIKKLASSDKSIIFYPDAMYVARKEYKTIKHRGKVTVCVFPSGSIILMGAKNKEIMHEAIAYIVSMIDKFNCKLITRDPFEERKRLKRLNSSQFITDVSQKRRRRGFRKHVLPRRLLYNPFSTYAEKPSQKRKTLLHTATGSVYETSNKREKIGV